MPFRITVTKVEQPQYRDLSATEVPNVSHVPVETEIFRQTVETLDLSTIVLALNKRTRVRKAKATKE